MVGCLTAPSKHLFDVMHVTNRRGRTQCGDYRGRLAGPPAFHVRHREKISLATRMGRDSGEAKIQGLAHRPPSSCFCGIDGGQRKSSKINML